ncbi:MAG: tripartite tricarboxylate transporter TctB family protein [Bacillota bacterium]
MVGLAAAGLGLFFIAGAYALRVLPGYARISPRFFPVLVGSGLVVAGVLLVRSALRGEAPGGDAACDWKATGLVAAGLLLHMALIERAGFILSSTLLFGLSAYALGSRRLAANTLVGLIVSAATYLVFTRGLGLSLPAGVVG